MKSTAIMAVAFSAIMGVSAVAPATAMPLPSPTVDRTTDVQDARVVVKYGYWRGHRGYRQRRAGYRLYNGFWYPPAAFVIVTPGKRWKWCGPRYNRYRCRY